MVHINLLTNCMKIALVTQSIPPPPSIYLKKYQKLHPDYLHNKRIVLVSLRAYQRTSDDTNTCTRCNVDQEPFLPVLDNPNHITLAHFCSQKQ